MLLPSAPLIRSRLRFNLMSESLGHLIHNQQATVLSLLVQMANHKTQYLQINLIDLMKMIDGV